MDPARRAHAAYGKATTSTKTPRQVEYQAFARITQDLRVAGQAGKESFPKVVEALHRNQQLWSILARNLRDDENELPDLLRAQLISLATFTRTHTKKVLAGEEESFDILIEINTAIMKGLSAQEDAVKCPA